MYTSFYRLKTKPFQLSPDPSFFYGSKGHKRAMAYLHYGLSLAEGFIVITGEVGAGKTMLVRNLFQNFGREKIVTAHLVSTQLDADDTLRVVASGFGLDHNGLNKAAVVGKLESFLQSAKKQGKRVLLVVDEAQNLTPRAVEELRMLSNFQLDNQPLIQSFLLGQPEFRKTLQSDELLQVRQRVIASYHLGPIAEDELRAYIEHRMATAGWLGDPQFLPEAYARIFAFTGGIPRKINTLCDRLMVLGMLEERHVFDGAMVNEVIKDLEEEVAYVALPASPLLAAPDASGAVVATGDTLSKVDQALYLDSLFRIEKRLDKVEAALNRLFTIIDMAMVHPPRS